MEIYDFSVAPGAVREIHCEGVYVYFYAGSAGGADATIELKHDASGERVMLLPGQAFRIEGGAKASRWIVGNHAGAATIAGRLVIGTGRIDDNRITGSVEVIDGGKNRSRSNGAGIMPNNVTAAAGNYPYHGIYNPAASGKVAVINGILMSSSTAQSIFLEYGAGDPGGTANIPRNKNVGGVLSAVSVGRYGGTPTPAGDSLHFVSLSANTPFEPTLTEPIVINPGQYVRLVGGTVATQLGSVFQFYEEAS